MTITLANAMVSNPAEPLLLERFTQLGFTKEFCLVCEIAGFYTPGDLLDYHTSELLKRPGFDYHLLLEFIDFLEKKRIGHYVDPE